MYKSKADLYREIVRLRKAGTKLEQALDKIDEAIMDPEKIAEDTRLVGGPVSWYCVDYDEDAVVDRVRKFVRHHYNPNE